MILQMTSLMSKMLYFITDSIYIHLTHWQSNDFVGIQCIDGLCKMSEMLIMGKAAGSWASNCIENSLL
jgi:hypothetical protein